MKTIDRHVYIVAASGGMQLSGGVRVAVFCDLALQIVKKIFKASVVFGLFYRREIETSERSQQFLECYLGEDAPFGEHHGMGEIDDEIRLQKIKLGIFKTIREDNILILAREEFF